MFVWRNCSALCFLYWENYRIELSFEKLHSVGEALLLFFKDFMYVMYFNFGLLCFEVDRGTMLAYYSYVFVFFEPEKLFLVDLGRT